MNEDSLITEELKSKIGIEWEPEVYEIERDMIRRFAQTIDAQNPPSKDEEYTSKSKYGGIIAPPTFILTVGFEQIQQKYASFFSGGRVLGGTELECYQPVRVGDIITVTTKIADAHERQGRRMSKMVFVNLDIAYTNQRQELVAKCRRLLIGYQTGGKKDA